MAFSDDLKAAKTADVPFEDVDVLLNGNAYTFRFRQMNGFEWQLEVDKHPVRGEVAVDATTGYNVRTLVRAVAPRTGVRVDGDNEVAVDADEWAELFDVLNGHDQGKIADAVWRLNDGSPTRALAEAVERAKKARTRGSKTRA